MVGEWTADGPLCDSMNLATLAPIGKVHAGLRDLTERAAGIVRAVS